MNKTRIQRTTLMVVYHPAGASILILAPVRPTILGRDIGVYAFRWLIVRDSYNEEFWVQQESTRCSFIYLFLHTSGS